MPPPEGTEGPHRLIKTKAFTTTIALSTLNKLLAQGATSGAAMASIAAIPAARRTQRLFGEGRTSAKRAGESKMELVGVDYDPRQDTCIRAFVRLLAARAHAEASPEL